MIYLSLVTIIVSGFLAFLRVMGEKSELFQACAHIWVGMLIAVSVVLSWLLHRIHMRSGNAIFVADDTYEGILISRSVFGLCALAISIVELYVFTISPRH